MIFRPSAFASFIYACIFLLLSIILFPYLCWTLFIEWHAYNHWFFIPMMALYMVMLFLAYTHGSNWFRLNSLKSLTFMILALAILLFAYKVRVVVLLLSFGISVSLCYLFSGGALTGLLLRFRRTKHALILLALVLLVLFPVLNYCTYRSIFWYTNPVRIGYHVLYDINHQGFRGSSVAIPKPKGKRRIMFLGDSSTFGFPYNNADTFSALLANLLRQAGYDAEALNMGVPGMTFVEIAASYDRYKEFDPDMIVLMTGVHYRRTDAMMTEMDNQPPIPMQPIVLLAPPSLLELALFSNNIYENQFDSSSYQNFGLLLEDFATRVTADHIPTIIVEYPSAKAETRVQQKLHDVAVQYGLGYIPARDSVLAINGVHFDVIHPNKTGHRYIAEKLFQLITTDTTYRNFLHKAP